MMSTKEAVSEELKMLNQLIGLGYASEVDSLIRNTTSGMMEERLSDYVDENSKGYCSDVWYDRLPKLNVFLALVFLAQRLCAIGYMADWIEADK